MQFPAYNVCSECHVEMTPSFYVTPSWYSSEVLEYLLDYYGSDHVVRDSAPYEFHMGRPYYLTQGISVCESWSRIVIVSIAGLTLLVYSG